MEKDWSEEATVELSHKSAGVIDLSMEVLFYFVFRFFTTYPNNPLVLLLYSSVLCFIAINKVSWSFSVDTNTSHFKTQRHEVGALTHAATH